MTDLPVPDPALVAALRADLGEVGYTVDAVTAALGPVASAALHREQSLPARRVTEDADRPGQVRPVELVVRAFTLGVPVRAAALDEALPRTGTAGLVALGLVEPVEPATSTEPNELDASAESPQPVERADELVRARLDLRPYGDESHTWWVASDLGELALGHALPTDHVLGIGGASATLASWTPRRPVRRALDLGTGCGIQALHLADHADTIVATDLSARALDVARLNAALAGQTWDLRRGDLLEPVAGERFDLVVSNPPFVITPRGAGVPTYEYRDGGARGDDLVRRLVRGVGEHLEPGGIAHFLANWEITADRTWRDRWQGWLEGTGLDAWVVQREVQDPAEYAELWVRDGGTSSGPDFERLYAAWLDDLASRGVTGIGFGVVTLQRPASARAPWMDLVEVTGPVGSPMGPTIDAGLRVRTWLAEQPDRRAALLDTAWRLADDVTEERFGRPGAEDPAIIRVRQGGGLGRTVTAGTALAAYLSVADGSLTPHQALVAIAALLERDPDEVVAEVLAPLEALVTDGLLTQTCRG
ncbi:N5-glutamine methyltransferase family protein [Arsenicicoccus dermatophilus]|uniref:N5-glutamine methyltransferase family protein n=1 Tax=Arsenicicoccus dermatophilus TaxID=1076331 RepID=UPI001F4C83F8|nr:class I SAM-dependent methyltransferase [Arsenicicoccus dermatophilus]MCH8613940.1 class I SAM-dependent methyltransferase [Arsenicicoccus dermatophilus]